MGNLLVRQLKLWYARSKNGHVVQDIPAERDDQLYYEFEFVIDPPRIETMGKQDAPSENVDAGRKTEE